MTKSSGLIPDWSMPLFVSRPRGMASRSSPYRVSEAVAVAPAGSDAPRTQPVAWTAANTNFVTAPGCDTNEA
jgi:hypothetical protein